MGRLFGTDGARGVAITELTCELAMQIGRAAALVLTKEAKHKAKIVIERTPEFLLIFWKPLCVQGFVLLGQMLCSWV